MASKKVHEVVSLDVSPASPPMKKLKEDAVDTERNEPQTTSLARPRVTRMSFSGGSPRIRKSVHSMRASLDESASKTKRLRQGGSGSNVDDKTCKGQASTSAVSDNSESSSDDSDLSSEAISSEEELPEGDTILPEKGASVTRPQEYPVDLFDDDEEDMNYHNINPAEMWCEVCNHTFKDAKRFIVHHRRHCAKDHYQCPTCFVGFTTLKDCVTHEAKVHHKKKSDDSSKSSEGQSQSDRTLRAGNSNKANPLAELVESLGEVVDEEEESSGKIVASTSLTMYRGPPVKFCYEAFEIEEKYGRRGDIVAQIEKIRNAAGIDPFLVEEEEEAQVQFD